MLHLGGMSLGEDDIEDDLDDDDDDLDGDDDLDVLLGGKSRKSAAAKVRKAKVKAAVGKLAKQQALMAKAMTRLQPSQQTQVLPFPRGEGGTTVTAGDTATVSARPQRPFQTQRFAWGSQTSAFFDINQLTIGQENMFVQAGTVPAEIFAQTGVSVALSGYIAWPGIDITLQATNNDTLAHPIQASIIGAALV
jgi:hypothetical protein